MNGISDPERRSLERREVEAVLASALFSRAPTLCKMLKYICERHLQGEAGIIKEYNIAVEALGRGPDFLPGSDSIVRVEAARLRKHLRRYYETEGAGRPLQIQIAESGYQPRFTPFPGSDEEGSQPADGRTRASLPPDEPSQPALPASGDPMASSLEPASPPTDADKADRQPLSPSPPRPRTLVYVLTAALLLVTVVAAGLIKDILTPGESVSLAPAPPPASPVGASGIWIRAGFSGPGFLDASGVTWQADRFFTGGVAFDHPGQPILRTSSEPIYQTGRQGDFSYAIPLKTGVYQLHLHFAETFFGEFPGVGAEKDRLFNVAINGLPVLTNFDVAGDAGGSHIADEKTFIDVSPAKDGFLHLSFSRLRSGAILNAITIVPGLPGKLWPVRIVCANRPYYDKNGNFWTADRYFAGGRLATASTPVQGSEDPGLYTSHRWGHFSYAVPVVDGTYTLRLRFAEGTFGTAGVLQGGAASRVFGVYCNGVELLSHFDIFQEAGGENRALVRTFRGLKPNAQQKLVFYFAPITDYPDLCAIEIEQEQSMTTGLRDLATHLVRKATGRSAPGK